MVNRLGYVMNDSHNALFGIVLCISLMLSTLGKILKYFLAHLLHSDKVTFCDDILSVVHCACILPSVCKQFLQMTSPPKPLIGF